MYSVLIVEDEQVICKSMCLMMERSGLPISEIKEAGDGKEALSLLSERSFDFVITDIRMPNIDGLELCREISEKWPETSMLIVSGYDDFNYAQQALKYGVKDYILKPVSREKLVNSLSNLIACFKTSEPGYRMGFNAVEQVIEKIGNALWEGNRIQLEETCGELQKLLNKATVEYFASISKDVLEAVIKRLSIRIGYDLNIHIDRFGGNRREECYQWFCGILNDLGAEIKERKSNVSYNMMEKARKYIEEHYNEDASLDDLGRKLNLNPCYLSQLFKQQTGNTFIEYRTGIRMRKAQELLCQPEKTITGIAFDVGYQSTSHFIRTFKKYFVLSPSEFRQKCGIGK